jgi:hypothetical protein
MIEEIIKKHKETPMVITLSDNKSVSVYLTDKNVLDDYNDEYYFALIIKGYNNNTSKKMMEDEVYNYFKYYIRSFYIEGKIFVRFQYD